MTLFSVFGFVWHLLGYGLDLAILLVGLALFLAGVFGRLTPYTAALPGFVFVAARYAGLALALYGGGSIWLRQHDDGLKAAWVNEQRLAVVAGLADAYKAGQDAVAKTHAAEVAAALASAPVIKEIQRRADANPQAVPAADAYALDELRRRSGARP